MASADLLSCGYIFTLGMQYLGLGVLSVFGYGFMVYILVTRDKAWVKGTLGALKENGLASSCDEGSDGVLVVWGGVVGFEALCTLFATCCLRSQTGTLTCGGAVDAW